MAPRRQHSEIPDFPIQAAYKALTFLTRFGNVSKFRVHGEWIMNKLTKQAVKDLEKPEKGQAVDFRAELTRFFH